jgi:arylsulfatase
VTDHISCFYDVLPTLCEVTGLPVPAETDGISFLPTLLGKRRQAQHQFLYWEFPEYGGQQAVRMGPWKGIITDMQKGNNQLRLYHLGNDLAEINDVAAENPEVIRQMMEILQSQHRRSPLERFLIKAIDQ